MTNPEGDAKLIEAQPANPDGERLVWTVEEAGRLLGISRAHAYDLVARGDLPSIRLGRRIVVPKHAIAQLIERASS